MSGNKSALPDNQNHPVLPIFIAVFREKGSVFLGVYFMRFPGFGAVALVVQTCLRGFPAFFHLYCQLSSIRKITKISAMNVKRFA